MNKLKEEKMVLSKQIMDLESEAMLYKKIESSEDLLSMNATTINNKQNKKRNLNICTFGFSYVNNLNRMKIKDSLKNKNEEILILKNELVQKERLITNLQKKYNNNKHNGMLYCNGDVKFGNVKGFEKNKSEGDFMKKVHVVLVKKYFDVENEGSARKERKTESNIGNNSNMKNGGFQGRKRNVGGYNDEGDDESQSLLENNIYSEIKNILEEKRNFILQTMTYENFSFDIICKNEKTIMNNSNNSNCNSNNTSKINSNVNNKNNKRVFPNTMNNNNNNNSTVYNNNSLLVSITKDIDSMLDMVRKRKVHVQKEIQNLEIMKESSSSYS